MISAAKEISADGSIKYLWKLDDGKTVESIYFTFQDKLYTCISSQVGCNVGCPFCETGKQRNLRNLNIQEIYNQVAMTLKDLRLTGGPDRLYQVAFAGMGEPLLNFAHVTTAAARLISNGLTETVSVSTSGLVPKMRLLADTAVKKLFISLHATTDELRNVLVPMNRKHPLSEVLGAARDFYKNVGVPVTATYLMFAGLNDTDQDLERLTNLLDTESFIIQLSEWNSIANTQFVRSTRSDYFHDQLASRGFNVFILRSKGADVEGGCGQLRSRSLQYMDSSKLLLK